jgi:hypothetical protein
MSSFVDDLLAGDALLSDLDSYVARWHEAPPDSPSAQLELHEYLGLSWPEYQTITERPHYLRFVVDARKRNATLEDDYSDVKIAARGDAGDARAVFEYLQQKSRLR